ncbi:hypothetical protein I350_02683 [Cryptococcus amylolentus CBS 6273]|uniref:RRM domain-containing protein n=1 Tax=Cryptococcus amylolentus CBS 6273 TaxID=1296118 RepID=A0A1E3K7C4_9TREE|nr:hypothetical protein I350_02683 [Cryptococcus amylolentus CBS 6273]
MSSFLGAHPAFEEAAAANAATTVAPTSSLVDARDGLGKSPLVSITDMSGLPTSRPPTSAEIDAVIAAAIANAPPPASSEFSSEMHRSVTPLMTNLLPSAVGSDGRVNLFVGNLPYRVRWQDLKDLFRKAGTVLRADVSLGPDNRSRGYGTVLMGSREDAARAIDRYNGYTWQTRTLEVRPDRLPPEYEPQAHSVHHNANPRSAMYSFHSFPGQPHAPFSIPGHLTPQPNGAWPGQLTGSRPFSAGAGAGLLPGMGLSPSTNPASLPGGSPLPGGQSPASLFSASTVPISVQTTGGAQPLAASPLAGSLTSGQAGPAAPSAINQARRDSLTPFAYVMTPPESSAQLPSSRPTSSSSAKQTSPNGGRAPPPGTLGPLPPSMFAGIRPSTAGESDSGLGVSPTVSTRVPQLEGLANQGMGLGPPSTLHDRVIFVSNLPMSMQWQDLKDMLRPAGTIIRADVATDSHGKPRGFGTALFATEADATRAVALFNDREVAGVRIRAHLERDIRPELASRSQRGSGESSGLGLSDSSEQVSAAGVNELLKGNGITTIDTSVPIAKPDPSPVTRLPWSLNTSVHAQAQAQAHGRPLADHRPIAHHQHPHHPHQSQYRQSHHPGPISMPAYHPMDPSMGSNPLSPLHTRGLPPMTPSMPGFVFNYPSTPPAPTPHWGPFSPGPGPFSPGVPVTSPGAFGYNPFLNAAPGAPVNMYPAPPQGQGGSAALGTPTTQAFPNGPIGYGQYAGPPGAPPAQQNGDQAQQGQDYFANAVPPQGSGLGIASANSREKLAKSPLSVGRTDQVSPTSILEDHAAEKEAEMSKVDDLAKLAEGLAVKEASKNQLQADKVETVKRSASGLDLSELGAGGVSVLNQRASMDDGRLGRH